MRGCGRVSQVIFDFTDENGSIPGMRLGGRMTLFPETMPLHWGMTSMCPNLFLCLTLAVAVTTAGSAPCLAQEVGSVDLTQLSARTELRRPLTGASRLHSGAREIHACRDSMSNAGALLTTLVSLDRTHYQIGDEPRFEVIVENVGSAPLRIPFSPHLADLQPRDPARKFRYLELQVVLWIAGREWSENSGGGVRLYGNDDQPDTMLNLQPGESVRITGNGKLGINPGGMIVGNSALAVDHAYARVSLYRDETLLSATAAATISREVCLRQMSGQSVPVALAGREQ
jgi:hypothetical protein